MNFIKRATVVVLLIIATVTVFITILANGCIERLEKKDKKGSI